MMKIESASNPRFRTWKSLLESKGLKKAGLALVSGSKIVAEFLNQHPARVEAALLGRGHEEIAGIPNYELSSPLFRDLDALGTHAPLLVVKIDEIPTWQPGEPQGLELIVALSDPGNMGAVLRSAEAFGATRVVLTQEACSPYLPRAIRAASGACFRIPLARTGPLADLNAAGYALDMHGEDIGQFKWPKDLYLVLGEEGRGLPPLELKSLSIPMRGQTESLNATTAASIALFSYSLSGRKTV